MKGLIYIEFGVKIAFWVNISLSKAVHHTVSILHWSALVEVHVGLQLYELATSKYQAYYLLEIPANVLPHSSLYLHPHGL